MVARVSAPLDLGASTLRPSPGFSATTDGFFARTRRGPVLASAAGRFTLRIQNRHSISFETLDLAARGSAVGGDGGLVIDRGVAIEHLRELEDGIEQSWRFDARPVTHEIAVRVRVTGMGYVTSSARGLHFRDDRTGLGVRYGVATFVDARGLRFPIVPRWHEGAIVLTVPPAVVARAVFPAVLDPIISAEFGIDQPIIGPSDSNSYAPAVAFDGTNYFVVFDDTRGGSGGLFGTRVSPSGVVLDPSGIQITSSGSYARPAIAFDGTHYLVVFSDFHTVRAVRIATDGTVIDSTPLPITSGTGWADPLAAASNGASTLVVWNGTAGVRVSAAGQVLDSSPIAIGSGSGAAAAFDGTNYWVSWLAGGVPHVGRIRPSDGAALDGAGFALDPSGYFDQPAALACTATVCMAAWADGYCGCDDCAPSCNAHVRGALFRASDGSVTSPAFGLASGPISAPTVAANGTDFVVGWPFQGTTGPMTLSATRVRASDGAVQVPAFTVESADQVLTPAAASNGADYLFAWREDNAVAKVHGARVSAAGSVLDQPALLISANTGPNEQGNPDVATDGTNYFVVWVDSRDGFYNPYGARIAADGTILDTTAIALARGGSNKALPRVAFGGGVYLVTWTDDAFQPWAARVAQGGALLDATPLALPRDPNWSGEAHIPQVVFAGGRFLVAWTSVPGGPAYFMTSIFGVPIETDGTIDTGFYLDGTGTTLSALATDGTNLLVVETSGSLYAPTETDLLLAAPDGTGLAGSTLANGAMAAAAAFDGTRYLVVWSPGYNSRDLSGTRVATDGTVLDPGGFAITSGGAGRSRQRVAFDGTSFLSVWQDARLGNTTVFGARINGDGTVRDPLGIEVAIDPLAEGNPAIASIGGNHSLVIYARRHPDMSLRVHARLIDDSDQSLPTGSACVAAADCQSGFCADGVCCATACDQPCVACNVAGSAGTCVPVAQPPRGNRPLCRNDGTVCAGSCNGTDPSCVYPPAGLDCRAASCSGYYAVAAAQCDGAGTCPFVQTYCPPYLCQGNACGTTCTSDGDCINGYYCGQGSCQAKKAAGTACSGANECSTNFCADGVCCWTACTDNCGACNLAGSEGYCRPVTTPVGNRPPCADDGSGCGGHCNGAWTWCDYPNATACGPASCAASTLTSMLCNGAGACATVVRDCEPYTCIDNPSYGPGPYCPGACYGDQYCASDAWCSNGACVRRSSSGACTAADQCASGHCVDGVCCDTACNGVCQACTAAKKGTGSDGVCGNIRDGTDPDRECTGGLLPCQVGACVSGSCAPQVAAGSCVVSGTCYAAGVSDPANPCAACAPATSQTGFSAVPNGTACDDGNACTQSDSCQSGTCTGGNPVACTSLDECHAAGVCNPATGACSNPPLADGTACSAGACIQGQCTPLPDASTGPDARPPDASSASPDAEASGFSSPDNGGCGCRVAGREASDSGIACLLVAAAMVLVRRRVRG